MKLIIIFITYLLGGVVDAVCGGGGLITLPVLFAIGVPAHIAVGTNQTSILPGVITSVVKFHKSGKIDIKNAIYAVPFGLIGGFAGARLNLLVSEWYLQVILLILIPVLAVFSVLKPNVGTEDRSKENTRRRTIILSAVIGFSVGAYHAFYGPASGTFYMLAFAAGAMIYVVVEELIPEASEGEHSNLGTIAFAIGFALMMMLDVALG